MHFIFWLCVCYEYAPTPYLSGAKIDLGKRDSLFWVYINEYGSAHQKVGMYMYAICIMIYSNNEKS